MQAFPADELKVSENSLLVQHTPRVIPGCRQAENDADSFHCQGNSLCRLWHASQKVEVRLSEKPGFARFRV
jgi:hypothetical protein